MILNVSGRTDIVAFYTEWFMNRYRSGFVDVRNPFNPQLVSRINFKDVDSFSINLAKKSFQRISIYLINKYKRKEMKIIKYAKLLIEKIKIYLNKKKIIRIYTVGSLNDHYKNVLRNDIIKGLEHKYNFEFTRYNPDYLVYDVFDCECNNSEYDNAIKIAFYTENQIPDFNKADYAIGFDNINYLDRYFRKTNLIWIFERRYLNFKNKDFVKKRYNYYHSKIKNKFCAAVISNSFMSNNFRIKFTILYNIIYKNNIYINSCFFKPLMN